MTYQKDLPLVTLYPDNKPTKIRPKEAMGIVIPYANNKIYDAVSGNYYNKESKKNSQLGISSNTEQPLNLDRNESADNNIREIFDEILPINIKPEHELSIHTLEPQTAIKLKSEQKLANNNLLGDKKQNHLYYIQLASVKTETMALSIWEQLKKKYPKILHDVQPIFRKAEKSENKFYFLLITGPYASLNKAYGICKRLIARGEYCVVDK